MPPSGQGYRVLGAIALLVLLGAVQNVLGTGHAEIHFLRYSANCDEDWGTSQCDPMFTFCLTRPQIGSPSLDNCYYANTGESSDHYHNTNNIDMEHSTSIVGHPNPWIVPVHKFMDAVIVLVIKIRDADIIEHDHLQTMSKDLRETVWPTKEQSVWVERVISQNSYTMRFKVRLYCDPYYYTSTCEKYCKPEDSSAGHYTCDQTTGEKICLPGWQGASCSQDIDECAQGKCVRGNCTNLPGDYTCTCPPNYTDKTCSTLMNPCRSQPCMNGGTCFAHSSEHNYICQCTQEWEGDNCENRKNPCQSQPCQNNGSCTASPDSVSYNCSCNYPYSGVYCEMADSTTISSTQTTIPTSVETTTTTSAYTSFTVSMTPVTSQASTTVKMMAEKSTTTLQEQQNEKVQQLKNENASSNFQLWYIALILAALLIILVILVIFFIKRRKRKAALMLFPPSSHAVSFNGDNLSFQNGLYADVNRNNSAIERQNRNLPPVPHITSSNTNDDDEMINPGKPTYTEVNEVGGAEGGCKVDESDLKKKSTENLVKTSSPAFGALHRTEDQRAETNPYTDFRSLRDSQLITKEPEGHSEESHYHDLDEIAASVQKTAASTEPDERSDGTLNFDFQATPFVDVQTSPYDSPTNNSSYYDTPPLKPTLPSPIVPDHTDNLIYSNGLAGNGNPTNNFTLGEDFTNSTDEDLNNYSSDEDDVLQEDLAHLRKAVKDNMPSHQTVEIGQSDLP